mmetsp:Transcript_31780/g.58328  ORF Transcript_31780/g.58328 Transcript_31780/m.58328 type:complete len:159 (+) Transcript_31780:106-582(+)
MSVIGLSDDELFDESAAVAIALVVAVPAIMLMCCVLEECPLKTSKTFEDIPFFCGVFSMSDVVGFSNASWVCFVFIALTIIVSAGLSSLFFAGWRGAVATGNESAFGFSALQTRVHYPQAFWQRKKPIVANQVSLVSFGYVQRLLPDTAPGRRLRRVR